MAEKPESGRAEHAANLFDLRRIIGFLFVAWGILLTVLGLTESDAEIAKAADVNINLLAGLGMLVVRPVVPAVGVLAPAGGGAA